MTRNAFYSFHYMPDCWRAGQVRNMGVVDGNKPASDNDWETITRGGEAAIKKWIDEQMRGRSVEVVLIGAQTAGRKWIDYEIGKAWRDGKGVLGVHVHNLLDQKNQTCMKGRNPFSSLTLGSTNFGQIAKAYDPPYSTSTLVYAHIKENLPSWIEDAIRIRNNYG